MKESIQITTMTLILYIFSAQVIPHFIRVASANVHFPLLRCRAFTEAPLPRPAEQTEPRRVARFRRINQEVEAGSHSVLFLGDSITQKWDREIWHRYFAPLDALNLGVNGDRTEHLLWRLKHGNLDRQHPEAVVLLIGTNDIGRNRPAALIADGIRANLRLLRTRLPTAGILLLGVLPRSESPLSRRRRQVHDVNALIRACADNQHVWYADFGSVLLDPKGRLTRKVSLDGVHLTRRGYSLFSVPLAAKLEKILAIETAHRRHQTHTQRIR